MEEARLVAPAALFSSPAGMAERLPPPRLGPLAGWRFASSMRARCGPVWSWRARLGGSGSEVLIRVRRAVWLGAVVAPDQGGVRRRQAAYVLRVFAARVWAAARRLRTSRFARALRRTGVCRRSLRGRCK
eukprot:15454184-Alexandrium_andersonii.AAC.1